MAYATAMPITSLIGAEIEGYDSLPAETWAQVQLDGRSHRWNIWGDLLKPAAGTRVLATYSDQFFAGTAAITQVPHGKGKVTYNGVFGEQSLDQALIEKLAGEAGLALTQLPPKVHVLERDGRRIVVNYQDKAIEAPAPATARFIIGGRTVPPAGVAVWIEG